MKNASHIRKQKLPIQLRKTFGQKVWSVVLSVIVLSLVLHLFTSISELGLLYILLTMPIIQGVDRLLQPVFRFVARTLGIFGILLISLFGYAVIM